MSGAKREHGTVIIVGARDTRRAVPGQYEGADESLR